MRKATNYIVKAKKYPIPPFFYNSKSSISNSKTKTGKQPTQGGGYIKETTLGKNETIPPLALPKFSLTHYQLAHMLEHHQN